MPLFWIMVRIGAGYTDLLIEGVHFDLTYVPLRNLGYKSAIVNFQIYLP
jgi:thiamine monophosphate kinase